MKSIAPLPLALLAALSALGPARAERPNIVFLFSDDHAYQAIGAYGSNRNETPHLDRIAEGGMLFHNCMVTNSICGPSRAVIQTGKHSHLNGFMTNGDRFDGAQQTFPKLLQKAGYTTAMIGKWHLKSDPTGFDYWKVLLGQGPYYNPPMKSAEGTAKIEGYTTEIITDIALEWLAEGRDKDRPFMLMCQHKAPHRNWQPGPNYLTMYDDVEIPEPATLWDDYETRASPASSQAMTIREHLSKSDLKLTPPRGLTEAQLELWNAAYGPKNAAFEAADLQGRELVKWKYQRYAKNYLRCVAAVDDNVGRVLDYLDEAGLAENTVVMYASDQGWYLGEHGWYDKRWMYEESFRTPFMVRWPGVVEAGSENRDFVSNLDFAQTFLDIAGVEEIPEPMQGASLVPILKGETPADWRKSFYYHYYEFPGAHSVRRHYGVRMGDHKLIHYYNTGEWELFDLKEDPNELNNLYAGASEGVLGPLKDELVRLRKQYRVPEDTRPVERRRRGD